MAAQPARGFRGFAQKPLGKITLIVICFAAVLGAFAYVSAVLAIPVILLVGLGLPIYSGVKQPKFLAILGVVVIVAVAPVATAVFSQELLQPVSPASSNPVAPDGAGGSVLQNASVSPFYGGSGTNFTWTVTIYPSHLPAALNGTNWKNDSLELFISTCPGATDSNASYCSGGYPIIIMNHTFAADFTTPTTIGFSRAVTTNGVWSWQMELAVQNASATKYHKILLVGDPNWNGIEGPIVGGFWTAYSELIGDIYLSALISLGIPFFFVLLLYMMLKNRERRRLDARRRVPGGIPPTSGSADVGPAGEAGAPLPGTLPTGPPATKASGPAEMACPKCQAVIYPNESTCWKCGAGLSSPSAPSTPG